MFIYGDSMKYRPEERLKKYRERDRERRKERRAIEGDYLRERDRKRIKRFLEKHGFKNKAEYDKWYYSSDNFKPSKKQMEYINALAEAYFYYSDLDENKERKNLREFLKEKYGYNFASISFYKYSKYFEERLRILRNQAYLKALVEVLLETRRNFYEGLKKSNTKT